MEALWLRGRAGSARVGHLGTVGADGTPHVVPVCFAVVGEVVYSAVDGKPKRSTRLQRIVNVQRTGLACLLVDGYEEDWTTLWWVRLDARGRLVEDPAERSAAVRALTAKYPQYVEDPPTGPVLALDVTRWSGWSARVPAPSPTA